jgi:hypothetical protein
VGSIFVAASGATIFGLLGHAVVSAASNIQAAANSRTIAVTTDKTLPDGSDDHPVTLDTRLACASLAPGGACCSSASKRFLSASSRSTREQKARCAFVVTLVQVAVSFH